MSAETTVADAAAAVLTSPPTWVPPTPVPPVGLPPLGEYPATGTDVEKDRWLRLAGLHVQEAERASCFSGQTALAAATWEQAAATRALAAAAGALPPDGGAGIPIADFVAILRLVLAPK